MARMQLQQQVALLMMMLWPQVVHQLLEVLIQHQYLYNNYLRQQQKLLMHHEHQYHPAT